MDTDISIYVTGKQFIIKDKLGQGAHGSVFKIIDKKGDRQYALKIMQSQTQEIDVLKELSEYELFPNIIDKFTEGQYEWLVIDLYGINFKELKSVSYLFYSQFNFLDVDSWLVRTLG